MLSVCISASYYRSVKVRFLVQFESSVSRMFIHSNLGNYWALFPFSNRRPLILEATALSSVPQPLDVDVMSLGNNWTEAKEWPHNLPLQGCFQAKYDSTCRYERNISDSILVIITEPISIGHSAGVCGELTWLTNRSSFNIESDWWIARLDSTYAEGHKEWNRQKYD